MSVPAWTCVILAAKLMPRLSDHGLLDHDLSCTRVTSNASIAYQSIDLPSVCCPRYPEYHFC